MSMGFKKTTRSLDFADLALANCLVQNRSIKNKFGAWFRQAAFNLAKGMRVLSRMEV